MKEVIEALILGIIQGLTEFLPISSSGHLELAKVILGYSAVAEESLLLTVTLHAATAIATLWVFRKDVGAILKGLLGRPMNESWHFALKMIISMVPAVIIGLSLEDLIEGFFTGNILLVGAMLVITGVLLIFADRAKRTLREITYLDALIIGIAQAIAILPGISRSGATIATSVMLGNDRNLAARFSFLMVVPLILGRMARDIIDGAFVDINSDPQSIIIGFIAAFITGVLACRWMLILVKRAKLKVFAIYCFFVALAVGAFVWFG